MKQNNISVERLSRRSFLGVATAITAGTILPATTARGSSSQSVDKRRSTLGKTSGSKYNGVQIGAITYSFRDLQGGVDAVLKACVGAGLSSVELMGTGVEDYLGAPKNPVTRRETQESPYTGTEKSNIERYRSKLREWRKTKGTPDLYTQLRKKFNDAGVDIHIYKWTAGNSDEELDYSFQVAKVLGAIGITAELNEENARLLGPAAERNGMYAILHNHAQYGVPGFDVDKLLAYSPANMLNFDVGHYYGSTGLNPADFIRKYHTRIKSLHLKDKTGLDNPTEKDKNQVWGQGETPLEDVLHLVRDQKLPIYCDIELEYPVASWSTSVKEVDTCRKYCRQILL